MREFARAVLRCSGNIAARYIPQAACLYDVTHTYLYRATFITICSACQTWNHFRSAKRITAGADAAAAAISATSARLFRRYFTFHRLRGRIAPNFAESPFTRPFACLFGHSRKNEPTGSRNITYDQFENWRTFELKINSSKLIDRHVCKHE